MHVKVMVLCNACNATACNACNTTEYVMHVIACNEIYYIVLQIHYMLLHRGGFEIGRAHV